MSGKSYYKVVTPAKCDTILHSSSPAGAAAKVYTHCISKSKKNQKKSHVVRIQRRSHKPSKIMTYRVKQKKESTQVMRDGKLIEYGYKVKVKSLNKK